jgi:hypothetical protein
LVAGGGAILGTGAFTTVTAERTVNVQTAGDSSAFLGITPGRGGNPYVTQSDQTVEINLDGTGSNSNASGLNDNAETVFRELVTITNNGSQPVTELNVQMAADSSNVNAADTFSFTVTDGSDSSDVTVSSTVDGNGDETSVVDLLTGENDIPDTLSPGTSISFGFIIDLINGGADNTGDSLPGNYTLTISAETSDSQ